MVHRYYSSGLSGSQYMSGHMVDHECDNNPIESYVVHSLYVGLVEYGHLGLSYYGPRPP